MNDKYPPTPETTDERTLPTDLLDVPRWLFSKRDDDDGDTRKRPRAPWNHPDWPEKYVAHNDPENWVSGPRVLELDPMYLGFSIAFSIPNYSEQGDDLEGAERERHVLIDHDDVIVDGKWHPASKALTERLDTYTQVSSSGTGVHNLARGQLPEGITAMKLDLSESPAVDDGEFPNAEVEIYDNGRYVHMTGDHVAWTPEETRDVSDILADIAESEGVEKRGPSESESKYDDSIDVDEEALTRETTTSKKVMSEAMRRVTSDDIRLYSTKTGTRANGVEDYDPSWADSKSGTRLGKLGPDHFLYRDGNVKLDTLQVVALEEGIVHDPEETIEGKKWMDLAEALRMRGAHIPRYDPGAANADNW